MTTHIAKPAHEVAYQDLTAVLAKHRGNVSPLELLAIAANMVGKIVAMQDQRVTTVAIAMEVVAKNIEIGNAQLLAQLSSPQGSA